MIIMKIKMLEDIENRSFQAFKKLKKICSIYYKKKQHRTFLDYKNHSMGKL